MRNKSVYKKLQLYWQVGAWNKLNEYNAGDLELEDNKLEMALMIAVACLQCGELENSRQAILCAKKWGASEDELAKYLLSGLNNSIGLAHLALNSKNCEAKRHFKSALELGSPDTDLDMALSLRLAEQKKFVEAVLGNNNTIPTIKRTRQIELGEAWAGNIVNTAIFRCHGLLTMNSYQFTAFYVDSNTLRIVQRSLTDDHIQSYDILGEYNLKDAHNSINLGADRDNFLHICYDHHGGNLRYRRTLKPMDINDWSEELSMTGKNEERVTYPTFIMPLSNSPLLILYRDGHWKRGVAYLKYYVEDLKVWRDYSYPVLSGADQKPWTSSPYWNHPVMDEQGTLHLSFCWRTDYFNSDKLLSNINIDYAKSYDYGHHWYTSKNHPFNLPITQVNSETVCAIAPGQNLINQTSMTLDSKGHPHIIFYANDEDDITQYQHVWFDGRKWHQGYVSKRRKSFVLSGADTLQIPISRPDLVIDRHDNIFVVHNGEESQQRMAVTYLPAPNYEYYESNTQILHDAKIGFAEPVIDHLRWKQENVLSILIQENGQPNGDIGHILQSKPVSIVDIIFKYDKK
jgi:hypothetical protein